MAGGKETPRQKMIGMMYLVLTALLALNVSKQVIAAFITLNDKLDASAEIIDHKVDGTYGGFDQKKAALQLTKGDTKLLELWQDKADELKDETALVIDFLLKECNEMIKEADGVSWIDLEEDIETKDGTVKVVTKLKPLIDIQSFDNYDIPTNLFVGGDPEVPNARGLGIPKRVHEYRDHICGIMGTYDQGKSKWIFESPEKEEGLEAALESANPADTAKIRQIYLALTLPEELETKEGLMPWPSVMFHYAPIVAAAAMFTSVKLDVKNAEAMASEYMLSKVDAPPFNFNKIEPLAFARTSYINQGDSLVLSVKIAAYDSNEVSKIRYGLDADTANPENWKELEGDIALPGSSAGAHKVKGQIGVKEKGEISWKNFDFNYNVGQPMGVVALPEMRVLYWGYNNIVEGTASGYDPSMVSLSGSGVSLSSKGGGQYIAKVGNGTKKASISVSAKKEGGGSVSLGKFDFKCKPFPPAMVYFAGKKSGEGVSYTAARNTSKIVVAIDPSSPITTAKYSVTGGEVFVTGLPGIGNVSPGGSLDGRAKGLVGQAKNKTLVIEVRYKGPDGIGRIGTFTGKVR
jgi:GldM N-terminal domain/GldM third domain/GldM second domain